MGDVLFTQQSAYILVQTTLIFSPTCSFIVMRQTPNWGFSRRTKRSLGDPLGACSAIYLMSFNQIIICLVDRSYPIELDINDTTNTAGSHSYIDLHLTIDNDDRSRTKLHNNFSILDFQFKCSDIQVFPSFITDHIVRNQSNTTGASSGEETAYLSGAPEFIPRFVWLDFWFSVQCFVDRCLSVFFWLLSCLSFVDLRILITPLVSSNCYYYTHGSNFADGYSLQTLVCFRKMIICFFL